MHDTFLRMFALTRRGDALTFDNFLTVPMGNGTADQCRSSFLGSFFGREAVKFMQNLGFQS